MTGGGLRLTGVSLLNPRSDGGGPLLERVDADFPVGEIVLITGPVGAGKSALLHLSAGLHRPTEGVVYADGKPISRFTAPHLDKWRRSVGIVFQTLELLEDRTVFENIMLPLYPRRAAFGQKRAQVEQIARKLWLTPLLAAGASTLSGGERQRTAVARALVTRPRYLLADEPTAHLDARSVDTVVSLLLETRADDAAVVVVSHDPRLDRLDMFDRRYHVRAGRVERRS